MAENTRKPAGAGNVQPGPGIHLAKIISHLDPTMNGSLEVSLLKSQGNQVGDESQTVIVKRATPFYGYTAIDFAGMNTADKSSTLAAYGDTQKSYGMWFVPPDPGVIVLVVFIDNNPAQGYWIGCIPPTYINQMVPGIACSETMDLDKNDTTKYDTKFPLPVAEINKKINNQDKLPDPKQIKKPVHPIADRFLEEGLLEDVIRGTCTSTGRREVPSMVFGISTPGPVDRRPNAKKGIIGTLQNPSQVPVPIGRLGGSQFVMDDGNDKLQRQSSASTGKMKYVDSIKGGGDPTIPFGECFRLRTRTGHQILMHNSEDLIYIGNSKGTAWIELTSNGKIDIYANDSISIHTQQDLNIRADRDINLEAGRNINMRAAGESAGGNIQIECKKDLNLLVGQNGSITTIQDFNLNAGKSNKFTAGTTTEIKSGGNHIETASKIHMNGPAAGTATKVVALTVHNNVVVDAVTVPWKSKRYQSDKMLESIMYRIPMHEPWGGHENYDPTLVTPDKTDRDQ